MTGFESLLRRAWLVPLAPAFDRNANPTERDRALRELALEVERRVGGHEAAMESATGHLRRSVVLAVAPLSRDTRAERAALDLDHEYRRLLEVEGDLADGLGEVCREVPALAPHAERVVAAALPAMVRSMADLLPRSDDRALEDAQRRLQAWRASASDGAARALARDRGGVLALLGRHAEAVAAFTEAGATSRVTLARADEAIDARDLEAAAELTERAQREAHAEVDPLTEAAAWRRAAVVEELSGRLEQAVRHHRQALDLAVACADEPGQVESIEEVSRLLSDQGSIRGALTVLGLAWELHRSRGDASQELRALQLAGRLLCERADAVDGLLLLLHAHTRLEHQDPDLAHLLQSYIVGLQYTLDDVQFARLEARLPARANPATIHATLLAWRDEDPWLTHPLWRDTGAAGGLPTG